MGPSLLPMLRPTLTIPTDTTATATDSTGHTDTAPTTVDIWEDTEPTDIPTTDKHIAARFFQDICPDTTQMCSESQSQNVESHLSKSFETKKSLKIKHKKKTFVGAQKKKKKKKKK